ncbi:hypothetical protein Tco_1555328 [Tanacetum coccineum]
MRRSKDLWDIVTNGVWVIDDYIAAKRTLGLVGIRLYGQVECFKIQRRVKREFLEFIDVFLTIDIPDEKMCLDRPGGSAIASWALRSLYMCDRGKDAEGPSLDGNRVLREVKRRLTWGVESDLVDSLRRRDSWDDSGDCGNVTTDDNEDVTPVIAPEKDSIIAPPSTPSDMDSDKTMGAIETPMGTIHRVVLSSATTLWKDSFPVARSSDLELLWQRYRSLFFLIMPYRDNQRMWLDRFLVGASGVRFVHRSNSVGGHGGSFLFL